MGLYDRLLGTEAPKIEVHQFCAALAEQSRLRFTAAQVKEMFRLSVSEQAEYDAMFARVSLVLSKETEDVLELGESGYAYTTPEEIKSRFGVLL